MPKMTDEDRQKYEEVRTEYHQKIDARTDLTDEQKEQQKAKIDELIAEDQEKRFGEDNTDNPEDVDEPDTKEGIEREPEKTIEDDDEIDR